MSMDSFVPFQNRYIDVGAGGPNPFTFTAEVNVSWLHVEPSSGSVSPSSPETRVFVSVDWSQVNGAEVGLINFVAKTASKPGLQPDLELPVTFIANHTTPAPGFRGEVFIRYFVT